MQITMIQIYANIFLYAWSAIIRGILAYALFGIHMLLLAQLLELLRPLFIAATEAIESGLSEVTTLGDHGRTGLGRERMMQDDAGSNLRVQRF